MLSNQLKSFLFFGLLIIAQGAQAHSRPQNKSLPEKIEKNLAVAIEVPTPADLNTDYCRVINDQGIHIGNINPNDFLEIASEYAEKYNLCTVTDVKEASGRQVLFDKDGYSLGEKLTKQQVSELQKNYGLKSCHVLTCEIRKASRDNIADGSIYSR
jgi:hypothetical protein